MMHCDGPRSGLQECRHEAVVTDMLGKAWCAHCDAAVPAVQVVRVAPLPTCQCHLADNPGRPGGGDARVVGRCADCGTLVTDAQAPGGLW